MSNPMQADALEAAAKAIAGTEWDGVHDRPRFRREAEAAIRAYHEAVHAAEPEARALTCADLAEALECVWNAAIGESHRRQSDIGVASIIAESFQAVAARLREISGSTSTKPAEPKVKALEWKKDWRGDLDDIPEWRAETPFGRLSFSLHGYASHDAAPIEKTEAAKAEIQANHEKRVLSCIEIAPAPKVKAEPVVRSTFPILGSGGARVDYQLVVDHGKQAQKNHYQSVAQLAERGGLSWSELYAVLHNQQWRDMDANEAMLACRALEAKYLAAVATHPEKD